MTNLDLALPPAARAVVLPPGGGRAIPLGEAGVLFLKAGRWESGGTISAYEYTVPPVTAGPPVHLHRGWDELFYVLEGEMTFLIAGVEHSAPAGSFVFIPRGILHTFWNAGPAPARQLTVFTPAGIEDYFDAVTAVMAAGGEDTLEAAAALMAKHDMIVPESARPAYGALGDDGTRSAWPVAGSAAALTGLQWNHVEERLLPTHRHRPQTMRSQLRHC